MSCFAARGAPPSTEQMPTNSIYIQRSIAYVHACVMHRTKRVVNMTLPSPHYSSRIKVSKMAMSSIVDDDTE